MQQVVVVLGRFRNSSVPVLIFSTYSVPVPTGFTCILTIGSGYKRFGSSVLTVPIFDIKMPNFLQHWVFYNKFLLDFL